MGYDSNECLVCYCDGGVNNCHDNKQYNVCADCFKSECGDGLRGNACSSSYVQICPDVECTFCEKKTICLYQISICLSHVKYLNKENKELKENTYTGEPCRGCNCPHCPVYKYKDLFI